MPRAIRSDYSDGTIAGWLIHCPACGYGHLFDKRWTFNGDVDRPTFKPSMLVNGTIDLTKYPTLKLCHSFVTAGRIEYLNDCTHDMAGQTVELGDVPP